MRQHSIYRAIVLITSTLAMPAVLPEAAGQPPGGYQVNRSHFDAIEGLVAAAIAEGKLPGCVVLIGHRDEVVFEQAFGNRQVEPRPVPMTTDTVFDLASLTKPIATATSVMILVERGQVRLRDRIAQHIPEFAAGGKGKITVEQLLTHQGGLIPDNPLADYQQGAEVAWEKIWALEPQVEPGTRFVYTDVGFLVLGELVKRVSGQDLHEFTQDHVFAPLGMTETGYLPGESLQQRTAPTEKQDDRWLQGEVHDPRASLLGGIAGHAGLFSTCRDLSRYARMMLAGGRLDDVQVLAPRTIREMTTARDVDGNKRGLGWDMKSVYSRNRGELFSRSAFGHGGFTGTTIWMDPELDLHVVLLSNRLHPDGEGEVNDLAGRIGTIAAAALSAGNRPRCRGEVDSSTSKVLTGIDVLVRDRFQQLAGRRVGLITNHTGVDRQVRRTADLLHQADGVELAALFSPEHGIAGKLDESNIADSRDEQTNVPIYSLYGESRKPLPEQLAGIDTLVFDIQDIGARFYTYISTLGLAMEVAAEAGLKFVVLDRPNPIGGEIVAGPMLDAGRESFVAYHSLPVRHGMTVGELARMFLQERNLSLELEVIRAENWSRRQLWDATELIWINPSPNMRSLTEAVLYPGIGLLETTNLSVGRGTDTPFEVVGAPWIDGRRLAAALNKSGLPGVRFVPIRFTPSSSKHQGELCQGINLLITDRDRFESVRTGLQIAVQLRRLHPDAWDMSGYMRLLGNQRVFDAVADGRPVAEIEQSYQADLHAFLARRTPYLLYPK